MFTNQTRRRSGGLISRHILGVAALILAVGTTTSAYAAYPDHQIKLVIPFAPGGGNDAVGRTIGKLLTESLGQPVVVENMAGAGGKIGIAYGLRSKPDGYTLTLISNSYAVNASLYQLPFDPVKDMTPVGMIAHGPFLITTTGKLPVSSLQDLIRLAKAKKGSFEEVVWYAAAIVYVAESAPVLHRNEIAVTAAVSAEEVWFIQPIHCCNVGGQ